MDYGKFIVVTDRKLCRGDFLGQIQNIIMLHPDSVILREKDLPDEDYYELAVKVQEMCRKQHVRMYVNSRTGIAAQIRCENIHLPAGLLAENAGKLSGFENISVSCHSMEDVRFAEENGASRIILGTIFETECKKGLKGRGLSFVSDVCRRSSVPVYAIGGIKESNIEAVMQAGAAGGCMMSGFMQMEFPMPRVLPG